MIKNTKCSRKDCTGCSSLIETISKKGYQGFTYTCAEGYFTSSRNQIVTEQDIKSKDFVRGYSK